MSNISRILMNFTCVSALVMSTACTTTTLFPRQDLSPVVAARIKTIALLRIDEPSQLSPPIFANAALGALGIVGVVTVGAILMNQLETRTGPFSDAIHKEQASFSDLLVSGITSVPRNPGTELVYLQDSRPATIAKNSFDYSSIPRGADAFLHIRIDSVGCRHDSSFGGNCFPIVEVTARLIEPSNGEVLFRRTIAAGHVSKEKDREVISDIQDPSFENFDAVMANTSALTEALRVRTRSVASHIVNILGLASSGPSAAGAGAEQLIGAFPASWIVTVQGQKRTRILTIRSARQSPTGEFDTEATYGWSDRPNHASIDAQIVPTIGGYRLELTTPAEGRIVAVANDLESFKGEFTGRKGARPVTLQRVRP